MTILDTRRVRQGGHGSESGRRPGRWTYISLAVIIIASLFPLYWQFLGGSHTLEEFYDSTPPMLPGGHFWENATRAFDTVKFWKAMANSLFISSVITFSVVLFATLAGFAFAKLRFRGRNGLMAFVVATMAVPTQLGIIPMFILMSKFGWIGSVWSVIIPTLVTAFGVFWMRQYLVTALPDELIEAARVDGCSMIKVFWHTALPAARPAAAMLALFTFILAWNDFMWPLVAMSPSNPTVQTALNQLQAGYQDDWPMVMAATTMATIPLLLLFIVFGRQIVAGIMSGAVKG
jgi:cellobiose transport system permease protein